MSESNRTYRIRTNIGGENSHISVKLDNDIDFIEILSMKIDTSNFYKLHTSNYGCIAGRVIANGGVGVPNAKVSVFVGVDEGDENDEVISQFYNYTTSFSKDGNGVRYNLFPDTEVAVCHSRIGTFPNKRKVLDDPNMSYVFDKYYTFTTRTNDSGDYMIFGVPTGNNTVHTDIDLSDVGFLSQKPRDMIHKGYSVTQFENANKFKSGGDIDTLAQVVSDNSSVYVYPFWGDTSENTIGITRHDVQIQYKFEPTCVFMGSMVSDDKSNGISKKCVPTERMGKMDKLTTGTGTIEMIRKTPDGNTEEFAIDGTQLIDGNGTWCYQIPMNLDYYVTDEYGNLVPSDDKDKGIPTRARVRFRVSLNDFQSDYQNNHLAKVLVPNNPKKFEDLDYHFGSETKDGSFKDLFWNNVYTVKSYIPRIQKGNNDRNKKFSGIKDVANNSSNNPIPYNNMRVHTTFMFILQCSLLTMMIKLVRFVNGISFGYKRKCIVLGDGICPDLENWYFAPGCPGGRMGSTEKAIKKDIDEESTETKNKDEGYGTSFCLTNRINYLMQCVEINLAMEYGVIQFDFYNDWINGLLYIPRWFVEIRKKRSYLFGLIRKSGGERACNETFTGTRRYVQQCALTYTKDDNGNYTSVKTPIGCRSNSKLKCHHGYGRKKLKIFNGKGGGGIVHTEKTYKNQSVYYFRPSEWMNNRNAYTDGNRVPLFATDIVLLGSLDVDNMDGIPQAFRELVSSTYVLPSNLADTNMDSQQFMYGKNGKGTRCTGKKYIREEGMEPLDQTNENYIQWSKNTDYYERIPDEIDEYPITEAAGIDWGYTGPNQYKNVDSKMYNPGGHFLSISCHNSAVNIKSCVNLSRICEIGVSKSQRHYIVRSDENNDIYYSYIVPNGLINKYDITDSNFRKMFASLNHNGLSTEIDPSTGYLRYKFVPLQPNGFNGELKTRIDEFGELYNTPAFYDEGDRKNTPTGIKDNGVMPVAYMSTIESPNADYYKFRLGIMGNGDENEQKQKFLMFNNSEALLPAYENSFYFYFGMKDGNTAFDRFLKDYYAPCDNDDEDSSFYTLTEHDCDLCGKNGKLDVSITGLDSPFTVQVTTEFGRVVKLNMEVNDDVCNLYTENEKRGQDYNDYIVHNYTEFTINGLEEGTYTLSMTTDEAGLTEKSFTIGSSLQTVDSAITVSYNMFTSSAYDMDELSEREPDQNGAFSSGGSVTVSGISNDTDVLGVIVYTDDYYTVIGINENTDKLIEQIEKEQSLSGRSYDNALNTAFGGMERIDSKESWKVSTDDGFVLYVPAWNGNDTYSVDIVLSCTRGYIFSTRGDKILSESYNILYTVGTDNVTMPSELDYYIADPDISYRKAILKYGQNINGNQTTTSWVDNMLNKLNDDSVLKWKLKYALFYRDTMYSDSQNGSLNVVPVGGTPPYDDSGSLIGGEYLDDNGVLSVTASGTSSNTYSRDMSSFILPTHYITSGTNNTVVLKSFDTDMGNKYAEKSNKTKTYDNSITFPNKVKLPNFTYILKDSDGNETKSAMIPSIYRPFYMNALCFIGIDNKKEINVRVINAISYDGKIGRVEVKTETEPYKVDSNKLKYDDLHPSPQFGEYKPTGNRYNFQDVFAAETFGITLNEKDTLKKDGMVEFSVEVDDGHPKKYSGNVEYATISDSLSTIFPTEDNDGMIGSGIRFYGTDADIKRELYNEYNYRSDTISGQTCIWNGIYGNSKNNLFHDITYIITSYLTESGYTWENFSNKISDLTAYNRIYAIYDKWTMVYNDTEKSDYVRIMEAYFGEGKEPDTKERYTYAPPHENIISIVKQYK